MPMNTPARDYQHWKPQWDKQRHGYDGETAVKDQTTLYLPKPAGMDNDQYHAYRLRAKWYDAPERTVNALVGMVLRRDAALTVPTRLKPHLDDITLTGISFTDFHTRVLQEVILQGRYGVELDFTPADAADKRPVWSGYRAENILRVKTRKIDGRQVPWLIVVQLESDEDNADDPHTDQIVKRYRELRLTEAGVYQYQEFQDEQVSGSETPVLRPISDPVVPTRHGRPLRFIPFQFFGAKSNTPDILRSPMAGVINTAYAFYRHSADYEHGLHLTALPTPIITGHEDTLTNYLVGSLTAWQIPEADAKVFYLEYHGQGLDAIKGAMDTDKVEIATLGTRFLEMQPSVQETLGAVRLRHGTDEGNLALIASLCSEGIENLLQLHAWWNSDTERLNDPEITFAFYTDFLTVPIASEDMHTLWTLVQEGGLSYETFFWNMQQGERIPPGHDVETELALIEAHPPAVMRLSGNGAA